jgi:cell wall-associated NlpC family hydrolase
MVNYQSLIGRVWEYKKFDCYTLMRDYFSLLGIDLPHYKRPDNLENCESIFLDQMPKQGFEQINLNERLPNDVLIMKIGTRTPMHAAILLPEERILHQRRDSLSCVEAFNAYYRKSTHSVFRYAAKGSAAR